MHQHLLSSVGIKGKKSISTLVGEVNTPRAESNLPSVTPRMIKISLWQVISPECIVAAGHRENPVLRFLTVPQHFQMTSLKRFRLLYHPKAELDQREKNSIKVNQPMT